MLWAPNPTSSPDGSPPHPQHPLQAGTNSWMDSPMWNNKDVGAAQPRGSLSSPLLPAGTWRTGSTWMERPQGLNSPSFGAPSRCGAPHWYHCTSTARFWHIHHPALNSCSLPAGGLFLPRVVGAAGWAAQNSPWTGADSGTSPPRLIFFLWWKAGFWDLSGKNKVLSWGAWAVGSGILGIY